MNIQDLEKMEKIVRSQLGLANELAFAISQFEQPVSSKSIIESYIDGYFPYAREKMGNPKECIDYMRSVSGREDILVRIIAKSIRDSMEEAYVQIKMSEILGGLFTETFNKKSEKKDNSLESYINKKIEELENFYGVTMTIEYLQILRDVGGHEILEPKNDDELDQRFSQSQSTLIENHVELSQPSIDLCAIRIARQSIMSTLMEKFPQDVADIAYAGSKEEMYRITACEKYATINQSREILVDVQSRLIYAASWVSSQIALKENYIKTLH